MQYSTWEINAKSCEKNQMQLHQNCIIDNFMKWEKNLDLIVGKPFKKIFFVVFEQMKQMKRALFEVSTFCGNFFMLMNCLCMYH